MVATVGRNITKYRRECRLSRRALAKAIGKTARDVERYEFNFLLPSFSVIESIAKVLRVNPNAIAGLPIVQPKATSLESVPLIRSGTAIKSLHSAKSACGDFYLPVGEKPCDYIAILAESSEMNMCRIDIGCTVLIKKQTRASNGDIILCAVDGQQSYLRRYERKNDQIILTPESNEQGHEILEFLLNDKRLEIIGKAISIITYPRYIYSGQSVKCEDGNMTMPFRRLEN